MSHLKYLPRVALAVLGHVDTAVGVAGDVDEDHQVDHVAAVRPRAKLELAALDVEGKRLDVDLT